MVKKWGHFRTFIQQKRGDMSPLNILRIVGVGRPDKPAFKKWGSGPKIGRGEGGVFDIIGITGHIARPLVAKFTHIQH